MPDGRGDFEHNAALLVVDRNGRLLRIFDLSQQQLALDYGLGQALVGIAIAVALAWTVQLFAILARRESGALPAR